MRITVDYDHLKRAAVITADPECPVLAWAEVRRVCEERGQEVTNETARMLTIPWWSLLSFRQDIGYIRRKLQREYEIDWHITSAARQLLERAREREDYYARTENLGTFPEQELAERLQGLGFIRILKPYQLRNVARLVALPAGATFSVPGAGKTTEALAVYMLRREPDSSLIVVAPKNAFAVWEEQLEDCIPDLRLRLVRLQGGLDAIERALDDNPDIGIISYQQLPRVVGPVASFLYAKPCFLFLDESHHMKAGLDGVSGSAILRLCHLPVYKLLLSGTPMPNSVADLVPQFNFLYPEVRTSEFTAADCLRKVYVRTTKNELGLEPAFRIRHEVDLSPAQRTLYEALTDDVRRRLIGLQAGDRLRFRAFARSVMHLLQAVSDPSLLAHSELGNHSLLKEAILDPSPKVAEACRIARELAGKGHKCVIWSFFVQTVEQLATMLSDLGAEYIHGGVDTTPDETVTDSREAKLRRFHDNPSCMVLIANPAACAESISLHRVCHHAIYVDRTYNAAQYLQSEDRIHRLGMEPGQNTYVTILHAPGTIDDSVERRLMAKVAAMANLLNDQAMDIRPLDLDDYDPVGLDLDDLDDLRQLLLGGK